MNVNNKLISLRIPSTVLMETSQAAKLDGYANIQEFIREAVREKLRKRKIRESLLAIEKLKGSAKGKKLASKKEINDYILKEFGN